MGHLAIRPVPALKLPAGLGARIKSLSIDDGTLQNREGYILAQPSVEPGATVAILEWRALGSIDSRYEVSSASCVCFHQAAVRFCRHHVDMGLRDPPDGVDSE